MPNWIPGKQGGKAVRVQYNLPVRFKLESNAPNPKKQALSMEDVDEMPVMATCGELKGEERKKCSNKALINAIYKNIKYPKEAKENKVEGMVVAKFVIDKDGSVIHPEIKKALGSGCDEEVLRVVSEMPKWIPGKKDGKPVAVEFMLPVKFKMQDKKPSPDALSLKAFPNPASEKLSVEFKLKPGNYKLTMTDIHGKTVYSKNLKGYDGKTFNLTDYPVEGIARGTLYVTLTDEKGNTVKSTTVVLQ